MQRSHPFSYRYYSISCIVCVSESKTQSISILHLIITSCYIDTFVDHFNSCSDQPTMVRESVEKKRRRDTYMTVVESNGQGEVRFYPASFTYLMSDVGANILKRDSLVVWRATLRASASVRLTTTVQSRVQSASQSTQSSPRISFFKRKSMQKSQRGK